MLETFNNLTKLEKIIEKKSSYLVLVNNDLNLSLEVKDSLKLELVIINKANITGFINVDNNANLEVVIIDFSSSDTNLKITGQLLDFANATYHLATRANLEKKVFDINLQAKGIKTNSLVKMNGVLLNKGQLVFLGSTDILKGAKKSKARQEGRIANLSKDGQAQVSPSLNIYENDVNASHGAALGKVNDDVLFYLTSRGLTKIEAINLITLGYLKPVISLIDDEKIRNSLLETLLKREGK